MLTALDLVEARLPSGVVVTTSAIPKFYSNGLDLALASSMDRFFENHLYKLLSRFISYPMPTIALVNGHAFAGGFMLAMHHDYRVFSGSKGFLSVNEIDFGAPIPFPLLNIYQIKVRPNFVRDTVLEGKRWTAQAALEAGLIDSAEGWKGVEALVKDRNLVTKGSTGVYRLLKKGIYREQLAMLDSQGDETAIFSDMMKVEAEEKAAIRKKAEAAKL
ncbi:ClpP/crotonase-like domain-containing protein [Microdochium trichocladiopsis]|uniref:ClpP/crotonase-like domain-containing protein n=1 Tax=Microdochium trichocladiopsis TaxID=1682393 RepID=A0A9P8YH37_9PEZI|nr:ClpP/crotonase-like domain-containing protein [Microdochium trichocladiopsis]KAH7039828.1 ClpP/crotonase-like domain-containing protein [Microdochium trichocladiopsis]